MNKEDHFFWRSASFSSLLYDQVVHISLRIKPRSISLFAVWFTKQKQLNDTNPAPRPQDRAGTQLFTPFRYSLCVNPARGLDMEAIGTTNVALTGGFDPEEVIATCMDAQTLGPRWCICSTQ